MCDDVAALRDDILFALFCIIGISHFRRGMGSGRSGQERVGGSVGVRTAIFGHAGGPNRPRVRCLHVCMVAGVVATALELCALLPSTYSNRTTMLDEDGPPPYLGGYSFRWRLHKTALGKG